MSSACQTVIRNSFIQRFIVSNVDISSAGRVAFVLIWKVIGVQPSANIERRYHNLDMIEIKSEGMLRFWRDDFWEVKSQTSLKVYLDVLSHFFFVFWLNFDKLVNFDTSENILKKFKKDFKICMARLRILTCQKNLISLKNLIVIKILTCQTSFD